MSVIKLLTAYVLSDVIVVIIFELEASSTVGNNNLHILLLGSETFDVNELFKNKFNPPEYCPTREST
jgi:hypothetical protein